MPRGVYRGARRVAAIVVVAAFWPLQSDGARAQPRTAILSGIVTNLNGVPIAKAEVMIVNTDLRVVTDNQGEYQFISAPAARVRVIVRRIGFEAEEGRVTLDAARPMQLDFEMKGIPEELDSVMIREAGGVGRMSEFWARRMNGNGAFITRDEIERRRPSRASDLLRTVTGVRVTMGENTFERPVIAMGRNPVFRGGQRGMNLGADCRVTYYVDGSYVPPGTFHMDDISPLHVEAVEVYRGPAETPAKFRQRDTACGIIVIWTREPPKRPPGERK